MNHVNEAKWLAYVQHRLPENERAKLEEHLYSCDVCLDVFMSCLELADASMPLEAEHPAKAFDESVLRRIEIQPRAKGIRELLYRPLFRYAVAAAITALLMGAGAFDGLKGQLEKWQTLAPTTQQASISGRLTERTSDWLGKLESTMLSKHNQYSEGGLRR